MTRWDEQPNRDAGTWLIGATLVSILIYSLLGMLLVGAIRWVF